MKRGSVVAVIVAGLAALAPAAHASPVAPTPSAEFTTSVNGEALPVSTMTGAWHVTKPGRAATFTANGVAATGTETTVRTTWISAMRRVRGVDFEVGSDYKTIAPGSTKNDITVQIQFRTKHSHQWQEFGSGGMNYNSQPLSAGGQGGGALVEFIHPVTVQWRVIAIATFDDTSQQSFRESLKSV